MICIASLEKKKLLLSRFFFLISFLILTTRMGRFVNIHVHFKKKRKTQMSCVMKMSIFGLQIGKKKGENKLILRLMSTRFWDSHIGINIFLVLLFESKSWSLMMRNNFFCCRVLQGKKSSPSVCCSDDFN